MEPRRVSTNTCIAKTPVSVSTDSAADFSDTGDTISASGDQDHPTRADDLHVKNNPLLKRSEELISRKRMTNGRTVCRRRSLDEAKVSDRLRKAA